MGAAFAFWMSCIPHLKAGMRQRMTENFFELVLLVTKKVYHFHSGFIDNILVSPGTFQYSRFSLFTLFVLFCFWFYGWLIVIITKRQIGAVNRELITYWLTSKQYIRAMLTTLQSCIWGIGAGWMTLGSWLLASAAFAIPLGFSIKLPLLVLLF